MIRLNIILPSTTRFPKWSLQVFLTKFCTYFSLLLNPVCPRQIPHFLFDHLNNILWWVQNIILMYLLMYHISRPIRHAFSPEKCDLNSTCVLCAEVKYYFQTYKYPYPHWVKTTMKMILVAVTTIFWVSMMNKLYYGC